MPASEACPETSGGKNPDSQMSPGRWLATVLGTTLAIAIAGCWASYRLDLYCLFGDAHGKSCRVLGVDDRWAKYLLSMNYIPANFDGLLVGTSKSLNWDTERITAARIYNGSLGGANITEAKAIASNVLARKKLRVVLFLVFPFMTESSGFKSGALEPRMYWEALGSLRLFRAYIDSAYCAYSHKLDTTGAGVEKFKGKQKAALWAAGQPVIYDYQSLFKIDSTAYKEYGELVQAARSNGALIVRVRPPIYLPDFESNREGFLKYYAQLDALFDKSDPLIDFSASPYQEFQNDRKNFLDGSHLTYEAGVKLMDPINNVLRQLLK